MNYGFLENLSCVNSTYKTNVFVAGFFSVLISSPENIEDVYASAPIIVVMVIMTRQALYGTSPSLMWFSNLSGIILFLLEPVPLPFPMDLGGQNHCVNKRILCLPLGLIDLQCLFGALLLLE